MTLTLFPPPPLPVSSTRVKHLRNAVPLAREPRVQINATSTSRKLIDVHQLEGLFKGIMATGGFKSNATTDFLEEWKAKREKMRAKMLGDIAASAGAPMGVSSSNNSGRHAAPPATESTGSPDRNVPTGNCLPSSYSLARSSSGTALKRPEEDAHHAAAPITAAPGSHLKKAPPQPEKGPCASPDPSPMACTDSDKESPSPSKVKEKNSSGPSARKGKGQIEKRKLREKRRSTGVVSIPSNEVSPPGVLCHTPPQGRQVQHTYRSRAGGGLLLETVPTAAGTKFQMFYCTTRDTNMMSE